MQSHLIYQHVAQSLIKCDEENLDLIVSNLTGEKIWIPAYTLIAKIEPMSIYGQISENSSPEIFNMAAEENLLLNNNKSLFKDLPPDKVVKNTSIEDIDFNEDTLDEEQKIVVRQLLEEILDLFATKNPGTTSLVALQKSMGFTRSFGHEKRWFRQILNRLQKTQQYYH